MNTNEANEEVYSEYQTELARVIHEAQERGNTVELHYSIMGEHRVRMVNLIDEDENGDIRYTVDGVWYTRAKAADWNYPGEHNAVWDEDEDENEDMSTSDMYDYLTENGIATEEEIALITSINGDTEEQYEAILFARTGYRSFDQMGE
jgi:hypothetical protein